MTEPTEADRRFLELCQEVRRRAMRVYGAAGNGNADKAANLAIDLADYVGTQRQQFLMQQEQSAPDAYSLAALRVDTAVPSNSETGWERQE